MSAPYPWLTSQWQRFDEWRAAGRVPHAILLSGPAGWGKRQLALRFALELLGIRESPVSVTNNAGSKSDVDELDGRPVHADLRWVEADPDSASRQIKIDQIRELVAFVAGTSMSGAKVAVIAEAERMNNNAANALLKTLEEPAGRAHIILLSNRPSALLATVRSRCQQLPVAPAPAAALAWLRERDGNDAHSAQATALDAILWLTGDAPLRALQMQQDNAAAPTLHALRLVAGLAANKVRLAAALVAVLDAEPVLLLDAWVRALHALNTGAVLPDALGEWQALSVVAPLHDRQFADLLMQAKRELLGTTNPNHSWLFENLLVRWQQASAISAS